MKKILVPTDFSECARAAEETAIELAKKSGAEIHFLHTIYSPVDWVKVSLKNEKLYPETKTHIALAKNELKKAVDRAEKNGVYAREFLAFDKGREEIDRHAKNYKHDFIVMGTYGAKGPKELIGSNTQKIIRNASVPVLAVKKKIKVAEMKNIVFASTFDENADNVFRQVASFAGLVKANIHLLSVNTPYYFKETDEAESDMRKFAKKYPSINFTHAVYSALNAERGIRKFSASIRADLIALATHGRKGIWRMINPSVTEDIVNHSSSPVLSINLKVK